MLSNNLLTRLTVKPNEKYDMKKKYENMRKIHRTNVNVGSFDSYYRKTANKRTSLQLVI